MTGHPGIRNPYKDPEPKKPTPKAPTQNPDPENAPPEFRVKLDGDSFGVSFRNLDEDENATDIAERLAKLLYEVNDHFRAELRECGIKVLRPTIAYVAEPGEMVLRSKTAVIVVSTGIVQSEAAAFRRIGHALHALPIKNILEKHNAQLYVRG